MNKVDVVPKCPNGVRCVSLGGYQGGIFFAYGCGKRVCILQANTLIIQQVTEDYDSEVSSVSWARTGGKLAVGLDGLFLILTPKDFSWGITDRIVVPGRVKDISWSFFNDCILAVGEKCLVCWLDLDNGPHEIWSSEKQYSIGSLSPDGRLIALVIHSQVHIYFKDTDFSMIQLNHQSNISWIQWKDIKTLKLYTNTYNPNALIVSSNDGWIKVWSEYFSPTGLGFNIVFQVRTTNGIAAWILNYNNLENHISLLALKQDLLKKQKGEVHFSLNSKSCLVRSNKTQPDSLMYGAVLKDRIPVEWLVIYEDTKVLFYCCEGIGSYPVTAINIRMHLEIQIKPSIWRIHAMPLFAIREGEEIQLLGLNTNKDFVRWRRKFDGTSEEEFELTAIRGGHDSTITEILCHKTLPLVCSVDNFGSARIWTCIRGMHQESQVAQNLVHWGILQEHITTAKWLELYALILTARKCNVALFKWDTPSLKELKMPSIVWKPVVTWDCDCTALDVSRLEVMGNNFKCIVVTLGKKSACLWSLVFDGKYSVSKIWEAENEYVDCRLYSSFIDSTHCDTYLYTLTKNSLASYNISSGVQLYWQKNILNASAMRITGLVSLFIRQDVSFFGHDGSDQGQLDNIPANSKLTFFNQESSECVAILNKEELTIMVRQPLKIVGESELQWKYVTSLRFQGPVHLCSVSVHRQFITSHNQDLQVYTNPESSKLSLLLSAVSDPKPLFHPLFLLELLRIQKEDMAKAVLSRMNQCIDSINYTLNLEIEDFINTEQSSFSEENSITLKKKINEKCMELPGLDGDIMIISQLIGIVDSIAILESQNRSLDEYAKVFLLNVKMFKYANEQKVPSSLKPLCLTSMEIAWALHSEQQDTLFQILFSNVNDWHQMKMYGMGLWIKNQQKLKKMIEDIAMNDYRKNREPKNIALWYMALGKKNILAELFKKDAMQTKIYNFIRNDFNDKEWQIKAQKNAYELRKQMKFELSAAFFILGNQIESAIEILAESMFDPQLALVIARLKEGENSNLYRKVLNDYFLATALKQRDPWLASISYTLLGNFSESIYCIKGLAAAPSYVSTAWNTSTAPVLSGFHPSLCKFTQLLRSDIMVKRDCDDKGLSLDLFNDIEEKLAGRSARSYLRGGLPVLALVEILKTNSEYSLINIAVKSYLAMIIKNCDDSQLLCKFNQLVTQVRYCSDKFNIPIQRLINFVSDIFYKKDLRHYQCAFLLGCGLPAKGAEALLHQASLIHIALSRFSRDPCFNCSHSSLHSISNELQVCMKILVEPGETIPQPQKFQLMHIGIAVYLSIFLQSYQSGACNLSLNCLQALDTYLNTAEFVNVNMDMPVKSMESGIVGTWLRFLMTNKLLKILEKFRCRDIDAWLDTSLSNFNLIDCSEESVECALGPGRGLKKRALMSIAKLRVRLKSMIRRILLRVSNLISNQNIKYVENIIEIFASKSSVLSIELTDLFVDYEEYHDFDLYFEGNSQIYRLVQASAQSISTFIYEKPGKVTEALEKEGYIYQESIQENLSLFKTGLEVFKSKDPIIGFTINTTDKKSLVAISNGKRDKIREINLEQSLMFKKINPNLELDVEDPETYTECMKQFENTPKNSAYILNPPISAAIHQLYAPQSEEFEEEMKLPPATWHRSPLKSMLASLSSFKSRQDKVEKIVSHPMLPLYVTGNELLTLWQFNRYESLQDFATSSSTTSKIISIKFNSFGDKLGACDQQGNFYLYKFDLQPTSFQPQLTLKNFSGLKASNFCFLNLGSVIATIGYKPKDFLSIYDTLLPPNRPPIHTENIGGKMISYLSRYQQLIITGKKGKLIRYDLRMREVVETFDSKHDHLTDMKLGPNESTFITGGTEGLVKIWDARGSTVREIIDVSSKNKNKAISQIECVDNTVFVSSQDGTIKLLRIIQQ